MSHLAMMILAQTLVPRTCSVNTMKLGVTLVLILTVAFSCLEHKLALEHRFQVRRISVYILCQFGLRGLDRISL